MILTLFIVPVAFSIFLFIFKSKFLNIFVNICYASLYLVFTIILSNRQAAFTAYFRTDSLNYLFMMILAVLYFGISIYNIEFLRKSNSSVNSQTYYSIFFMLFVSAMTGVLLSTNLALMWVFIEATTLTSAYLIYFNRTNSSLEAAWKYIFICSIGISLAFVGIILLSLGMGNLNSLFFDDLYNNAKSVDTFWLKMGFVFILVGLGTKAGLAPVHAWLPDAHSEAPSPVSAMLSGALLNTALIGIIRIMKLMGLAGMEYYSKALLLFMGFLSLFVSAVFIIRVNNYKRMLAYSSIENIGIIAIGVGIGGGGVFAALLHIIAHSLAKASLFLTSGNILSCFGTKKVSEVEGYLKKEPLSAWIWILSFIAISGIPPFPVFFSEFLIVKELFQKDQYALIIIFFLILTIIIAGMGRIVFRISWSSEKPVSAGLPEKNIVKSKTSIFFTALPQVIFLTLLLLMGFGLPDYIKQIINNALSGVL